MARGKRQQPLALRPKCISSACILVQDEALEPNADNERLPPEVRTRLLRYRKASRRNIERCHECCSARSLRSVPWWPGQTGARAASCGIESPLSFTLSCEPELLLRKVMDRQKAMHVREKARDFGSELRVLMAIHEHLTHTACCADGCALLQRFQGRWNSCKERHLFQPYRYSVFLEILPLRWIQFMNYYHRYQAFFFAESKPLNRFVCQFRLCKADAKTMAPAWRLLPNNAPLRTFSCASFASATRVHSLYCLQASRPAEIGRMNAYQHDPPLRCVATSENTSASDAAKRAMLMNDC